MLLCLLRLSFYCADVVLWCRRAFLVWSFLELFVYCWFYVYRLDIFIVYVWFLMTKWLEMLGLLPFNQVIDHLNCVLRSFKLFNLLFFHLSQLSLSLILNQTTPLKNICKWLRQKPGICLLEGPGQDINKTLHLYLIIILFILIYLPLLLEHPNKCSQQLSPFVLA